MMQPEYLALLRLIVAETPHFPQMGALFRSSVPEQSLASVAAFFKGMRGQQETAALDDEAAARMLLGSLLTYALLGGLLTADDSPALPAPERLAAIVDLLLPNAHRIIWAQTSIQMARCCSRTDWEKVSTR